MSTPRRLRSDILFETRDGVVSNKDARLTNVLVESNKDDLDVLKRPGYSLNFSPAASGTGGGAFVATTSTGEAQIYSIVDNKLYAQTSTFSTTWTNPGQTPGTPNVAEQKVLYFNGYFYCLGFSTTDKAIYKSADCATWTLVTATPEYCNGLSGGGRRIRFDACVFNGKMWVSGGVSSAGGPKLNDVYSSVDGVTWTQVTAAGAYTIRSGHHMMAYNGKMWIFGSCVNDNLNDCWSSVDGITWTLATASAAWSFRYGSASFVLNGKLWLVGGSAPTADCYSTTDGITWTLETASPGWSARGYASTVTFGGYVWLFGGNTGSYVKDIWKSANGVTWTQVAADIGIVGTGGTGWQVDSSNDGSWPNNGTFVTDGTNVYVVGRTSSGATWSGGIYKATTSAASTLITTGTNATLSVGGFYDFSQTYDRSKIAIKNTTGAWQYTIAGSTLAQVSNANYPATTVRGLVYLDGTFYVMDGNGTIYGSNVNDFTTWSALNTISAQSEPDGGVCLIKFNQYVVAFGSYTIEFFYDAGNATGSPLSSVQNTQLLIGCANGDCVSQVQSSVFFPARSKAQGQSVNPKMFVAELVGMSYNRISTPNVDRILNADGLSGAWSWYGVFLGHPCYIINLVTTGYSLVYDLTTKNWSIFTAMTAASPASVTGITCAAAYSGSTAGVATVTQSAHGYADGDPITIAGASPAGYNGTFNITYVNANTYTYPTTTVLATASGTITATGATSSYIPAMSSFSYGGLQIFQSKNDGYIYTMSDTTYTDNAVYIDMHIRMANFDQGLSQESNSQNKFMPWIDVITDKPATSTLAYLRWSDDDYTTYVKYQPVDLSLDRSRINRAGPFVRRAFEFRNTNSTACRFIGLDVGLEQGSE